MGLDRSLNSGGKHTKSQNVAKERYRNAERV